jgi:hypothetical protein
MVDSLLDSPREVRMLWIRGGLLALAMWMALPGISHGMMPPVRELSRLQVLGVELRTSSARDFPYILFRLANGRDINLSRNGYHAVVRLNGRAYDAYTGAAGLPWEEYLRRLGARSELTQKVVATLVEQAP